MGDDILVMAKIKRADGKLDFTRPRTVPELMNELANAVPVKEIFTFIPRPNGGGYDLREVGQVVLDIRLNETPAEGSSVLLPTPSAPQQPTVTPRVAEPLPSSPSVDEIVITPRFFSEEPPEANTAPKQERPIPTPSPTDNNQKDSRPELDMNLPTPHGRMRPADGFEVIRATPEQAAAAASDYFTRKARAKSP